jgi:hypothetical protein
MINIPPINKSYETIQKGSSFIGDRFLRWLNDLTQRVNRAVVTDENGNIAYGDAVLPEELDSRFRYEFDKGSCKMVRVDSNFGNTYLCNNCYYDGITWRGIEANGSNASMMFLGPTVFIIRQSTAIVTTENQDLGDMFAQITITPS